MSWDAYVTNLLAGKVLEYAAIIGQDGNIWASNFGTFVFISIRCCCSSHLPNPRH